MILTDDRSQIAYPSHLCAYSIQGPFATVDWDAFFEYVCRLMSSWHVFKAVYEHSIVDPADFRRKADVMAREIVVFFQSCGSDATEGEVAGFLIQVLGEDFHTDVEDDSDLIVARWLIDGYAYIAHGDGLLLQELRAANLPLLPGFDGQPVDRITQQSKSQKSKRTTARSNTAGGQVNTAPPNQPNPTDYDTDYYSEDCVDDGGDVIDDRGDKWDDLY